MKKKDFALGILCGAMLFIGATAVVAGITAEPTWQNIYVDGEQVSMTAYNIAGSNYVKLRDIGQQVGFNVYWADGVQIDTDAPYTGVAPVQEADELPTIEKIRQEMIQRINEVRRENGVPTTIILLSGKACQPDRLYSFSCPSYNGRDNWPDDGVSTTNSSAV